MRKKLVAITLGAVMSLMCLACNRAAGSEVTGTENAVVTEDISGAVDGTIDTENADTTDTSEEVTEGNSEDGTSEWSPESLKTGLTTTIEYDKRYSAVVNSREDAEKLIRKYGEIQKATYDNPEVTKIEEAMEKEFGIIYVALGEIDVDTANDIYEAFKYMYSEYPELYGTLTDFTLGNFTWSAVAETRTYEFVTNANETPIVLKREIVIDAGNFLNREALLASCDYNVETGFWPENATVSMIIVHELGHHLLDVHDANLYGFSGYYVTDENVDAYRSFTTENLALNQDEVKRIIADAYAVWSETNEGSEEEFRGSISGYAKGIQSDGGVSYTETFAEAVADIYVNGEKAADASKLILEMMNK